MPSVPFTKEMKKDYTILIPNMSPIHFNIMKQPFQLYGYKVILLENSSHTVIEEGLRYVHNDMCYPALLVIGQMIDAIHRGICDPDKCALVISQTGGGCRASNYYFLLIKALERAGYPQIPVISLNLQGMNKNPGFEIKPQMLLQVLSGLIYGDMLMLLSHQVRPYEVNKGDTDRLVEKWTEYLGQCYKNNKGYLGHYMKKNVNQISDDFAAIKVDRSRKKVKVGVVGEIYLKYAPLGNNNLEDFLLGENCEVVIPGFLDFCLYCINDSIVENKMYGGKLSTRLIYKLVFEYFCKKQKDMIKMIQKHGVFRAPSYFKHTKTLADGYVSEAMNMGEGWLLTAEMLELIEQGVNNVVCTQPFGCLPNHIVGRGMMKIIKEKNPQSNIVSIDYDPSATRVNQENRIKLMLSNAKKELELA